MTDTHDSPRCHAATSQRGSFMDTHTLCQSRAPDHTVNLANGTRAQLCDLHAQVHQHYLDTHGSVAADRRILTGHTASQQGIRT